MKPSVSSSAVDVFAARLAAATHDLLGALGRDRRLLWANPAWRALLGWSEDELSADSYDRIVHPDDRPRMRALLDGERRETELRLRDRHGAYRWFLFGVVRSSDGELVFVSGKDVTARRVAEEELARSNAELEQFAYVASHDLSEPLRMVSSHLQLLRRRYHGRLGADADALVDYSVDGAARIAIGALPIVQGDPQGLGQLFQNLVGNAVKFASDGRPAQVRISAERDGSRWRFTVSDDGIGLDPGHAERIFGMFQRLHSRDEYPGTGMGLAIARRVVERHGGSIWAEPRPEGGSRFCFTLPAERE